MKQARLGIDYLTVNKLITNKTQKHFFKLIADHFAYIEYNLD